MASSDLSSLPMPLVESDLTGDAEMSTAAILPIDDVIPESLILNDNINADIDLILEWMTEMGMHRCTRITVESRDEIILRLSRIIASMMLPNTAIQQRRKQEWNTELNYNLSRMYNGEYDRWHLHPPHSGV